MLRRIISDYWAMKLVAGPVLGLCAWVGWKGDALSRSGMLIGLGLGIIAGFTGLKRRDMKWGLAGILFPTVLVLATQATFPALGSPMFLAFVGASGFTVSFRKDTRLLSKKHSSH